MSNVGLLGTDDLIGCSTLVDADTDGLLRVRCLVDIERSGSVDNDIAASDCIRVDSQVRPIVFDGCVFPRTKGDALAVIKLD